MKITLILTCYNHEKFIKRAFDNLIKQAELIDEIILCDDHSKDDSIKCLEEEVSTFSAAEIVRIYNKKNIGINATWNKALKKVTGDIIILQSTDDISSIDRIEKTIEHFRTNPSSTFLVSSYETINDAGNILSIRMRQGSFSNVNLLVVKGSCVPLFGMAFRSEFNAYLGDLPEHITNEDDFVGFIAAASVGISVCAETLYSYRIHQNSMSNWIMSNDSRKLKENFIIQQKNRIDNFEAIRCRLEEIIADQELYLLSDLDFDLFRQRQGIHEEYQNLSQRNFWYRLRLIRVYWKIISFRDVILISCNYYGLLLIKYIKNLRNIFNLGKDYIRRVFNFKRKRV